MPSHKQKAARERVENYTERVAIRATQLYEEMIGPVLDNDVSEETERTQRVELQASIVAGVMVTKRVQEIAAAVGVNARMLGELTKLGLQTLEAVRLKELGAEVCEACGGSGVSAIGPFYPCSTCDGQGRIPTGGV